MPLRGPFRKTAMAAKVSAQLKAGRQRLYEIWVLLKTRGPGQVQFWFIALAVLYFSKGSGFVACSKEAYTPGFEVNGFNQVGDTLGAIFGNFGMVLEGKVSAEMQQVFDRFGMGFYVTMLAELFLVGFIVFSIASGSKKSDAGATPSKSGGAARRPRPGTGGGGFPAKTAGDDVKEGGDA